MQSEAIPDFWAPTENVLCISFKTQIILKENVCPLLLVSHKLHAPKNKRTQNSHLVSTSLFPKGSKRNQPSRSGVLCKQAKGISTCKFKNKQGYKAEKTWIQSVKLGSVSVRRYCPANISS